MGGFRDLASWCVEYADGTFLSQYGRDGTETPYRSIEWPRVMRLVLESQLVRQAWDITPQASIRLSLRSRHFMGQDGVTTMCFILLGSELGKEVNAESAYWALYWFPDGTTHDCDVFDCPEARYYGGGLIRGEVRGLMPHHRLMRVGAEAVIAGP